MLIFTNPVLGVLSNIRPILLMLNTVFIECLRNYLIFNLNLKQMWRKAIKSKYLAFVSDLKLICRVFHKMLYTSPSPQKKKEPPPKENKLKMFLKRSSEPLLNLQSGQAGRHQGVSNISKMVLTIGH